ncbi:alanine/glycine:cation symporter family protein [Piscirickettsia litoralis]|uniref:alanine/glycine:cation symporter family protein n=1 Tax=Piscirickettsia litoralis TaxID=1891921 RepID=UPI00191468D8
MYFTLKLKFIQLRHFTHIFAVVKHSRQTTDQGISSFQALCTSLAARVGTGNIAGVAIAIYLGGPGSIFWMWLIALIGMATSFVEASLAQLFKVKADDGTYRGGPAYYIEQGLGKRWLGVCFSISLIIAFGLIFNAVQSNTIINAMHHAFNVDQSLMSWILVVITAIIIFGGIRLISRFAEMVVPFMALAYILVAFYVIITHITLLPDVITLIFRDAFTVHSAAAGGLGYTIAQAMMNGIKRGLFSNEAGLGSAANAAATASPTPRHPAAQGYIQMLGVFIDTMVICTATASIILLSGSLSPGSGLTGVALTQHALSSQVGSWGNQFIAIAILFFSFTTIVANYSYAENNLGFLSRRKALLFVFRLIVLLMVLFGAFAELPLIWSMADVAMGVMAFINLIAILLLSKLAFMLAKDYNDQLALGNQPEFHKSSLGKLGNKIKSDIWG